MEKHLTKLPGSTPRCPHSSFCIRSGSWFQVHFKSLLTFMASFPPNADLLPLWRVSFIHTISTRRSSIVLFPSRLSADEAKTPRCTFNAALVCNMPSVEQEKKVMWSVCWLGSNTGRAPASEKPFRDSFPAALLYCVACFFYALGNQHKHSYRGPSVRKHLRCTMRCFYYKDIAHEPLD